MPEISRFFGIIIAMYWEGKTRHHSPHFHAIYNEFDCKYEIPSLKVLDGKLPNRAHKLVIEWANLHRDELVNNWERVLRHQPLNKIEPLP